MNNYVGNPCPVCNNVFKQDDDIVVCPECGAPHHRTCYEKENHCALEANHSTGKAWQPTIANSSADRNQGDFCIDPQNGKHWQENSIDAKQCVSCGGYNPKDNIFCCSCGKKLNGAADTSNLNGYYAANSKSIQPYSNKVDINTAIYGTVSPNDNIDGITAREYAVFVGSGSNSYIPKFKKIADDSKRTSFNIFAFFFSGFYFLYRKMYKVGIILLIANLLLTIPSVLYTIETMPEITKLSISMTQDIFPDSRQQLMEEELQTRIGNIDKVKTQRYLYLDNIARLIKFAIKILIGFVGYNLYYKHSKDKITKIKNKYKNNDISGIDQDKAISVAGGKSIKLILTIGILMFVVYFGAITYYLLNLMSSVMSVV